MLEDGPFNTIFVSSQTVVPNLIGGLRRADALCNELAEAAGLEGYHIAWLTSERVHVRDRLGAASGWVRPDGRPFAASQDALLAGHTLFPPALDENGVWTDELVATATNIWGNETPGQACDEFDTPNLDMTFSVGHPSYGGPYWTSGNVGECKDEFRLYCLGVDRVAPFTFNAQAGRLVFVSPQRVAADVGTGRMDEICNEDAGMPSRTFRALVATTTESALDRVGFSPDEPPWVRFDGLPIVDHTADLTGSPDLRAAVPFTAQGDPRAPEVWTGASGVGELAVDDCDGWSSADPDRTTRTSKTQRPLAWFGARSADCGQRRMGLFCVEMPSD